MLRSVGRLTRGGSVRPEDADRSGEKGTTMYKTLVVGTDGSPTADKAVQAAADLARSLGAALHIVSAFRTPNPGMGAMAGVAMVDTGVGQALAEEAAKAVGQAAIEQFGEGLVAEAHRAQGNPDDVILSTAGDAGADPV